MTVSQQETRAEHWTRQPDGSWLLRTFTSPDDVISFELIEAQIRLGDAYADI